MFRRTALTVGLVSACLWGLLLVARADSAEGGGPARAEPYKPVAPVHSLMHAQAHHFDQMRNLVIDDSAEDRFKRLGHEAYILAELCNINAYRATKDDYRTWAAQARDQLLAVADAASKREIDRVKTLLRETQSTCRSCHDVYR